LIMPTLADSQLILITPLTLMPFSLAAEYWYYAIFDWFSFSIAITPLFD
jgi:hypothetical protein